MKTPLLKRIALCLLVAGAITPLGAQVIDKTPVLHFSFDNVTGSNVLNEGTGGATMNGFLTGTATVGPGGKFGNGLNISGATASAAYVRVTNAVIPLTVSNNWTLAMWIQTTTPGACYAYQGDGGWAANNSDFYLNNGSAAGGRQGGVRYGTGWEEGSTDVNDGAWHHLVMVCSNSVKTLYLDGVVDAFPVAANTYNGDGWTTVGAGAQFWVGGNGYSGDGSANLSGMIDEVYFFNRTLPQSEIQALYGSNNVPHVPLTVTVSPTNGYRGQVFTVTATASPASGTVTNSKVDVSSLGLSATASLVLSGTPNVFTNTFTVPANGPIGVDSVKATVIDTEPLIGSATTPFTVIAKPPTNALVGTQLTGPTNVYIYTEVTYNFNATNDSPDHVFSMNYTWYKNGAKVSTNGMGPNFTFLTTPTDNGATIQCIANIADPIYSNLTVTSGVITLATQTGSLVYTNGLKREVFYGASRANVEIGNVPHAAPIVLVGNADSTGGQGDNYTERYSGYFIPPTNSFYIFYVAADDDTDVYLSTDQNPANKRLICQETGYSGQDAWLSVGGNGSTTAQKRSDQFSPDGGITPPNPAGIQLTGGQLYYFESVHHNGTGGDNWGVTFSTVDERQDPNTAFVDLIPSVMKAANTNIAVVTWPGTNVSWITQPVASISIVEGDTATMTARATSDSEMNVSYQWYLNNAPYSGATKTNLVITSVPFTFNNAQIYVVASTYEGGLSITSSVTVLHVAQAVFEAGYLKEQRWDNQTALANLEAGTLGAPNYQMSIPEFGVSIDNPTGQNNFVRLVSGYFVPTNTGNYVFYTTGDDESDLFVSTDNTPANKRLVCHQAGWNNGTAWAWLQVGGGGATVASMRSATWTTNGVTPWANGFPNGVDNLGVQLIAGQRYYIEQDWHQGGGGANNAANFALMGAGFTYTDPGAGTETLFRGSVIGMSAPRCTFVNYTQQPTNYTTTVGGYATFSAAGVTDSLLPIGKVRGYEDSLTNNFIAFQWFTNGVAVPNAVSSTLTLGPLLPGDNGTVVKCKIRALGYADLSLNPIWNDSTPATLTVNGQAIFETGYAQHDVWTNFTSRVVVEQGGQGRAPYLTYYTPKFEGPVTAGPANAVQRTSGYFIAPATDNYAFYVNSDDDSDLFLSTDSTMANKRVIAAENVWSNPLQWLAAGSGGATATAQKDSITWTTDGVFAPNAFGIALTAGQKYYMEHVMHNGGGGYNAAATYYIMSTGTPPANGEDTKLTNNTIGVYVPRVSQMTFTLQPSSQTNTSGGNSVTFKALGTSASTAIIGTTGDYTPLFNRTNGDVLYQWYKNGVPIPGATSSNYTLVPILPSDNNDQFSVGIRSLGYSEDGVTTKYSNSAPATLTVVADTVPPTISYVSTFSNTNQDPIRFIVDVTFNEWMDTATANNILNYTVAGATVTSATLGSNHRTVELDLNQMPTLPLNITVNGIKDVSGNSIAANSTAPINPVQLTFTDIGTPGNAGSFGTTGVNPAYPSFVWIEATNGFLVSAEGSDIFGVADGFNFGWEQKTGDFDVAVRVVSNGHTSNFAKAGLMVREDLTAGSRNWSVINDPASADGIQAPDNSGFGANNIEANMRATNNVGTISWKTNTSTTIPAYPNAWVRIKRTGNVLIAYSSANSIDWLPLGAYDTGTNANGALPTQVYVGICTTAHNNDTNTVFKYYNTADYADYNSSFVAVNRAHLSTTISGTNVIVTWTPAGGHLESSPAMSGPGVNWQSLGTSNPATVPIVPGTPSQFLRVVTP